MSRRIIYDEDAVEQYQKMLVESLTSVDMEEAVNATGKALTAVICRAAVKSFGPLGAGCTGGLMNTILCRKNVVPCVGRTAPQ